MSQWLGSLLGWAVVGLLLLLLYRIIRMSLISPMKTKGARGRLRSPDAAAVARVVGFAPPPALVDLYRHSPLIDRQEFSLIDRSQEPPARWPIGEFIPLTAVDTTENVTVFGVSGIPIADDLDKGVYFVERSGAVILFSPDLPQRHRPVAPDIGTFASFEAAESTE